MRRKARRGGGRQLELTIESIGGRGDGIAQLDDGRRARPVFVADALPGERLRVRIAGERSGGYKAEVLELLSAAPERVAPPCPHFGSCGGCSLQHWNDGAYAAWKAALPAAALARRGLDPGEAGFTVEPLLRIAPGRRRRASLAATRRRDGTVRLGYHGRDSHEVVDLSTCLLLTPRLVELLPGLRRLLAAVLQPGEAVQLVVTDTQSGIDLLWVGSRPLGLEAREALVDFAERADLARLSWRPPEETGPAEPLLVRREPLMTFGGVALIPPAGGFLQPTAEGEAAIVDGLRRHLPDSAERLADLHAGCGTFSLALAGGTTGWRVQAVEGDAEASAALLQAVNRAGLAGRVTVETRDLARRPLLTDELSVFDALVFDPPRAGAREQAAEIALSSVPRVLAVSCNPNSFARDARILVDGGYRLRAVTPIDQFPWSGHLELVASFEK